MKKIILALVVLAALAGLAWLIWFKPEKHEEEEAKVETLVSVRVASIERATLHGYVTAYGVVAPASAGAQPAASARLMPAVAGVVNAIKCVEGQKVEQNALLIQFDSRVVDVAVEFAQKNVDRQKTLLASGGASQKTVLEAEQQLRAAQAQLALTVIRAPIAGTISRLNAKPGDAADLTTVLAEIVDLDRLVVSASVPDSELAALKVGQSAEIRVEADGRPLAGVVNFISPLLDPKVGTAEVRVTLPAGCDMRVGQVVVVRIVSAEHKDCLAVPEAAVIKDAESGELVIALVQGEQATQKTVTTGLRDGGLVEISGEGLQAGQQVVTQGAYGLPKKTKVRITKP
ncbi:MAG: efflux RND transporter periplasmic adaptor subunit [Kiritimatiellaeota bacterium]|nr:efflux RND transporter periplasmic adaptor subunit [Kiritimatiellota bacterium]